MKAYHDLMRHVLDNGIDKSDRTGTGTRSVFGYQMRFDLSEGFPLLTTKKLHLRSIIHELLWFLKGDTNIKYLKDNNVSVLRCQRQAVLPALPTQRRYLPWRTVQHRQLRIVDHDDGASMRLGSR